ncbi:thiol-activated cytolysin family protein [Streptomyces lydicus]|uniref:thiol-activated cytolysin family protein n=1 Tax=Streptomyces lydicus TaxID=47763 RepID=UPI00368C5444
MTSTDQSLPVWWSQEPVAWAEQRGDGTWEVVWRPGQGSDHYEVRRRTDDGRWERVAQGTDLAALTLPEDVESAGPGSYGVLATAAGRRVVFSVVGTGPKDGKADLAAAVQRWKKWGELAPHDADEKKPISDPQTSCVDGVKRTEQKWRITKTPEEIVTFNPNLDMMYPGAIVQAIPAIKQGYLVPVEIEDSERAELTVSVDALASGNSRAVKVPNYGCVMDAVKKIVRGKPNSSPNILFKQTTASSSTETALQLGVSGSYGGFSASLNVEAQLKNRQNTVAIYLRERAFTASAGMSTPNALINDTFTEERLNRLVNLGYMGPDNPPLLVSEVVFGRILVFSLTSTAAETDINAAVSASYDGFAHVSADVKARYQSIISNSEISILAVGGDPSVIQSMLKTGTIGEYFADKHTLDQYSPIGFVLKTLDGYPAKMSETSDYDKVTWGGDDTGTVDAVCHINDGYWFFSGDAALKYPNSGDALIKPVASISTYWPGLPTTFAQHVDAVCHIDGGYWFFSGDAALKYPDSGNTLIKPAAGISTYWPGLPATFAQHVDAVCHIDGGYWFFSGDMALKYPDSGNTLIKPAAGISTYWPALPAAFAQHVDAVCHVDGGYWFFSGDMALKYDDSEDKLLVPPSQITYTWPSLRW